MMPDPIHVPTHLLVAPILIPLVAGAIMLFYHDRHRQLKLGIGLAALAALMIVSIEMIIRVKGTDTGPSTGSGTVVSTYILGNWPVPIGIVLVLDRLSALMVMLTVLLAIPSLIFAAAGWQGKGQHYHSLFQFLIAGVNGAFLTGDLFNLFVFFEVMLAASYGLMLHGSGTDRIRQGIHYIAINLAASLLFLLGAALVYGAAGTLNMADISRVVPLLEGPQRAMFHAAAGFLGLAFLTKAAIWPLCFWLPGTYAAASPPAAASFAIMTKVGIYAILRLMTLAFGADAGASIGFGAPVLILGGLATMVYGTFGVLGGQGVALKGGHAALISSGTLLTAIGFAVIGGGEQVLSTALYYMIGSTIAVGAYFLLADLVTRDDEDHQDDEEPIAADPVADRWAPMMGTVEDEITPASDRTVSWSGIGICFALIAVMLAGLPPLPGFIGKFGMLSGVIRDNISARGVLPVLLWAYVAILIFSGFAVMIAMVRIGIRRFWASELAPPKVLALEIGPVVMILAMIVLLSVKADAVLRYTHGTAEALLTPAVYRDAVLSAPVVEPDDRIAR